MKTNAVVSGSRTSTLGQSRHGEAHTEITTTPSPLPPCSLLLHSSTHKCFSCGDGSVLLHRVPCLGGDTSYLCSSCVLLSNKKLYCVLCFQIIKEGSLTSSSASSPTCLTCCRCQRLTHLDCALKIWSPSLEGASLTLCKDCYARNNGQSREPPTKKQKMASVRRSKQSVVSACKVKLPVIDKHALTAAKIVAITAKREAFEAKQRAMVLAKAAARATAYAKAALDNVYKISQRQADKEEHAGVVDTESKNEVSITTAKRGLKRRALSAIVASETLSRDLAMGNRMATKEKPKKKQRRTNSDADNREGTPSPESAAEATCHRPAQRAKVGIKRRKTLSLLTKTHAVVNSKGSKLSIKKPIGSSSSTKGKLGAIVSQVLALSKISKTSKAAGKGRGIGLCCATLDDGAIDGIHENALTVSNDRLPSSGTIASIDACKPSHHGVVASCGGRIQDSKSFKEWMQCTNAMRTDSLGMIQEQLEKGRFGGCEAIGSQQERKLLNCLTKTMSARKSMYANGVTTIRGTSKR